jgi:hypothetical protein
MVKIIRYLGLVLSLVFVIGAELFSTCKRHSDDKDTFKNYVFINK